MSLTANRANDRESFDFSTTCTQTNASHQSSPVKLQHELPDSFPSSPIVHLTDSENSSLHRNSTHNSPYWRPPQITTAIPHSSSSRPTTPRQAPGRLWNPQNYSPRVTTTPTSIPDPDYDIPPVPVLNPTAPLPATDEYPLLTIPERRRSRQSIQSHRSPRTSLVVEPVSSTERSDRETVGLPFAQQSQNRNRHTAVHNNVVREGNIEVMVGQTKSPHDGALSVPIDTSDLETGIAGDGRLRRSPSKVTLPTNVHAGDRPDTQHGEDAGDDVSALEWGPSHPCYPHLNPHVPLSSPLYRSTRIIRVPRDWLVAGDLAPTFANVYPEVLDSVLPEDEFRRVVRHINDEVTEAFNPFSWRAWLDTILGVATFWLWDDLGFTAVKKELKSLEHWLQRWNTEIGAKDGVQLIPLRRTGYMSVCSTLLVSIATSIS